MHITGSINILFIYFVFGFTSPHAVVLVLEQDMVFSVVELTGCTAMKESFNVHANRKTPTIVAVML